MFAHLFLHAWHARAAAEVWVRVDEVNVVGDHGVQRGDEAWGLKQAGRVVAMRNERKETVACAVSVREHSPASKRL